MKYLIIDSDKPGRRKLKKMLFEINFRATVLEARNSEEAISQFKYHRPEVVLMDTNLPDMDGMDLVHHFSSYEHVFSIILTTANKDYGIQAYEYDVADYLLKPLEIDRLTRAIQKAEWFNKNRQPKFSSTDSRSHLAVNMKGKVKLVPLQDIYYLKAEEKFVVVRTKSDERYYMNETLNNLEKDLGSHFMRIHRNALISVTQIDGMEKTEDERWLVVFKDIDDKLLVSRRQKSNISRWLKKCA